MAAVMPPGSPSKATSPVQHRYHQQMAPGARAMYAGDDVNNNDPLYNRGRAMAPRLPSSPSKGSQLPFRPTNSKYGDIAHREQRPMGYGDAEVADNGKAKHAKRAKQRARSVSPSKLFRLRSGGDQKEKEKVDSKEPPKSPREVDHDFVKMLNEMQVPSSLTHKLMSLDARVKDSMIKGQATLNLSAWQGYSAKEKSSGSLADHFKRSKSSLHLQDMFDDKQFEPLTSPRQLSSSSSSSSSLQHHTEKSGSLRNLVGANGFNGSSTTLPGTVRSRCSSDVKEEAGSAWCTTPGAVAYATMLKANDAAHLDIARIKKMRAVLSAESPAWLNEFFEQAGYKAMIVRLQELLQKEWREEQHDDQLLHELLRCFLALASTDCGREALSSAIPTPFFELCDLLFSEKRPGELGTRKLLVELLCVLPSLPVRADAVGVDEKALNSRESSRLQSMRPASANRNFALLFTLLHNQRDPNKEAVVDFITASHTPRPFKTWVSEMLNVNRDYFWVFCHGSNRFWALSDVDVKGASGPKVPGGMTGGVEFEAMSYLTAHFRLVNLVAHQLAKLDTAHASTASDRLTYQFHALLFASGFDRTLAITRKASQTYYQSLHLEIARYFEHARRAHFTIPIELEAWKSSPQLLHMPAITQHTKDADALTKRSNVAAQRTESGSSTKMMELDKPLLNPHDHPTGNSSTNRPSKEQSHQNPMVGGAVRQWEERATQNKKRQPVSSPLKSKTNDSAYVWTPPKEWA